MCVLLQTCVNVGSVMCRETCVSGARTIHSWPMLPVHPQLAIVSNHTIRNPDGLALQPCNHLHLMFSSMWLTLLASSDTCRVLLSVRTVSVAICKG